jgi:hypothetical protein
MAASMLALDSKRTAAEFCADVNLSKEARALLTPEDSPRRFVERLMECKLLLDAIRVVARALSKPAAVRWACACAAPASGEAAAVPDASCVAAAVRWADDPSEDNRRAAMAAAAATDYSTPGAWAAAAAGWSGGSLAPPDAPVVPPPDHLTAHAVAGAVALAAASDPEHLAEREIAFLQAALDLADGRGPVPNGSGA